MITEPKPSDADPAAAPGGKPEQALSGGGSDTRAGSNEGGSAYGDNREDDDVAPEVSVQAAEASSDASPRAATDAVTNTGEPRPVKNREGIEGQPGDDVDAASG